MSQAKECWFADDATRCGPLQNVRVWWDELTMAGTDLGYYPNAGKWSRSLIRKRLPEAFLKKQQSTSPQKEGSIRVQPLAPRPTSSTTSTVERGTGGAGFKIAEFAMPYFWIKIPLDVLFRNSAWYRRSTRSSGVCNSRCPKTVHYRSQLYTSWTWAAGAASENRRHMLLNPSQVAVL